jgi:hypothetical protein
MHSWCLHVGAEQSIVIPAPQTKGLPELADTLGPGPLRVLEPPTLLSLDTLQSTTPIQALERIR